MGTKEAYQILADARYGRLDDSRKLMEAQRITGLTVGDLHEARPKSTVAVVYGDDESLDDQHGIEAISA